MGGSTVPAAVSIRQATIEDGSQPYQPNLSWRDRDSGCESVAKAKNAGAFETFYRYIAVISLLCQHPTSKAERTLPTRSVRDWGVGIFDPMLVALIFSSVGTPSAGWTQPI